jgi:D-lactate dehydrogenase
MTGRIDSEDDGAAGTLAVMRLAVFSHREYERPFLEAAARGAGIELLAIPAALSPLTAPLAAGCPAVSVFVGDDASAPSLEALAKGGTRLLALRCAGFNHVDLAAAAALGLTVARVPAYSPHAVAEHAVALMLALNRKIHRAFNRVREQDFSLDGLTGFDMHGKTAGIVGTGQIGEVACRILLGFGCRVVAFDPARNPRCEAMGVRYEPLEALLGESDIVSLHCPLTPATRHLIDRDAIASMRPGAMLVNTSRGAVIDTKALIDALKSGHVGSVGLDVYEEEGDLFFRDLSETVIQDDLFVRLMTFPNVLITAHQAFLTREALGAIADTTIRNAVDHAKGRVAESNLVDSRRIAPRAAPADRGSLP